MIWASVWRFLGMVFLSDFADCYLSKYTNIGGQARVA